MFRRYVGWTTERWVYRGVDSEIVWSFELFLDSLDLQDDGRALPGSKDVTGMGGGGAEG